MHYIKLMLAKLRSEKMAAVIVADPESPSRLALCSELRRIGHRVVAEVQDGYQALHKTIEFVPDLLILPLRLRRLGGIEVIHQLRRRHVSTRVLVLSVAGDRHFSGMAMSAGASGFVSRRDDITELLAAVEAVTHGHTFFADPDGDSLASETWRRTEIEQLESLSPRELTVFGYLAGGYSNTAIAQELGLSDRSISTFKSRLFRKFNIRSLVELAGIAERLDLLGPSIDSGGASPRDDGAPTLERTLDAMPFSVAIRDLRGHLLFANEYYAQHYGMSLRNAPGTRYADLEQLDAATIEELDALFAEVLRTDAAVNRELVAMRSGVSTAQAVWMSPVHDAYGKTQAVACGANRIDEYEATIVALRQELEQLRAANVVRANLVRESAQSVRQELDTLAALLESNTIKDSPSREALISDVARSHEALRRHWEALVEGVSLDDSALRAAPEQCDPVRVLRQVTESIATERGVRINLQEVDGASKSRPVWVQTSRFRDLVRRVVVSGLDMMSWRAIDMTVTRRDVSRGLVALQLVVRGDGNDMATSSAGDFEYPQIIRSLAKNLGARLDHGCDERGISMQVRLTFTRASLTDHV